MELLLKIGTLLMEMMSYEKTLDSFIELLRKDEVLSYVYSVSLSNTNVHLFHTLKKAHSRIQIIISRPY